MSRARLRGVDQTGSIAKLAVLVGLGALLLTACSGGDVGSSAPIVRGDVGSTTSATATPAAPTTASATPLATPSASATTSPSPARSTADNRCTAVNLSIGDDTLFKKLVGETYEHPWGGVSPTYCGAADGWVPGGWLDSGYDWKTLNRTIEFSGWVDDLGVTYTPGVKAPFPPRSEKWNNGMVVHAQYRTCCTISYESNGGTGSISPMTMAVGSTWTAPRLDSFTRPGYANEGWMQTEASIYMSCVYYRLQRCEPWETSDFIEGEQFVVGKSIVWRPTWQEAWTVTFEANGGQPKPSANQNPMMLRPQVFWGRREGTLNLNPFTRTGFTFAGWNTKADGTGTAYSDRQTMTPPADITLYAQWSCKNCYTVSFDANGGSGTQVPSLTSAGNGASVTAPAGTGYTKAGSSFAGWNSKADGTGTTYAVGSSVTPTSNMTLYAQWQSCCMVTFDANGGSGTMPTQSISQGSSASLTANAFTRSQYYQFVGWNTKADGTGASYVDRQVMPVTASVTLFAQWSQRYWAVTFNRNGGSGTMIQQFVVRGQGAPLSPNAYTRSGYRFARWNTTPSGTGTNYSDGKVFIPGRDYTLYAQWVKQ